MLAEGTAHEEQDQVVQKDGRRGIRPGSKEETVLSTLVQSCSSRLPSCGAAADGENQTQAARDLVRMGEWRLRKHDNGSSRKDAQ